MTTFVFRSPIHIEIRNIIQSVAKKHGLKFCVKTDATSLPVLFFFYLSSQITLAVPFCRLLGPDK